MNTQELKIYLLREIEELEQLLGLSNDSFYQGQLAEAKKILGYLSKISSQ